MRRGHKSEPEIPKSKYEMSLAEFPLAVLSKRQPEGLKSIEYEDTITGKDGRIVKRSWTISPSVEYGFGSPELLSTLFELFQIWKEQGFQSSRIEIRTLSNIVRRQRLQKTASAYHRTGTDLNALVGITVRAKNAFWDNELKCYVDLTFHLFERLFLPHERADSRQEPLPLGYIEASKELWGSVQANALITLLGVDSALFHRFTPTEQRLALYLGKMLHNTDEHRRDVRALASQLPLYAKRYDNLKRDLSRACRGLIKKGFPYLQNFKYEKNKAQDGENIIFHRKDGSTRSIEPLVTLPKEPAEQKARRDLLVQDILEVTRDPKSFPYYQKIVGELDESTIRRALSIARDADRTGEAKNPAALFTSIIESSRKSRLSS